MVSTLSSYTCSAAALTVHCLLLEFQTIFWHLSAKDLKVFQFTPSLCLTLSKLLTYIPAIEGYSWSSILCEKHPNTFSHLAVFLRQFQ